MEKVELKRAQVIASNQLIGIITRNKGALLAGDEGSGKTHVAVDVCINLYRSNVLFVTKAGAINDVEDKIDRHLTSVGEDEVRFNVVSYQKFAKIDLTPYDFTIFDECHMLKKFNTKYTTRFMKNYYPTSSKRKFLALSATPCTHHTLDFLYVIKACGAFIGKTPNDIKIEYFDGSPSRYGDFIEFDKIKKPEEFFLDAGNFIVPLKNREIDPEFPFMNINTRVLADVELIPPTDITEFTHFQLELGKKVAETVDLRLIPDRALVLCKYHEVARLFAERMWAAGRIAYVATDKRARDLGVKMMENCPDEPSVLITTLGLTQTSIDLNSISDVVLLETSYSWLLDRQSINRTRRFGKREDVNVLYITGKNAHPLRKTLERAYLEDLDQTKQVPEHSRFGPSSLADLYSCPGAYWLDNTASMDYAWHAFRGTQMHKKLEYYLKNPNLLVPDGPVSYPIKTLREESLLADVYGVEDRWSCVEIRPDFWGTCDFWACKNGCLTVADYKSGSKVPVKYNIQLWAYTVMIAMTRKNSSFTTVRHLIVSEHQTAEQIYGVEDLALWMRKIKDLSKEVDKAESNPYAYIGDGKTCSPFCRAHELHKGDK